MANNSIDLVSLDFDDLTASFVAYMRTQDRFKDYDFTGANLRVLLENMAYNTHKNAFYLNMAISEGFLDSAQLRPSVLSHAKELNYLPRSTRSAKANITVRFQATGDSQPYVIPKGQTFTAQVKNQSFLFSIPETLTCASSNTSFSFTTDIYEGSYVKDSYIFDTTSLIPLRFKITNPNVDTDSIVVNVFEDQNVVGTIYKRALSLLDLDNNSKIYFIQTAAVDGNYEIFFGDNILGKQPKNGSLVVIDYRLSSGKLANGSGRFAINFDPTSPFGETTISANVVTNTAALGGAEIEDIETTRFYAPRWFQTQERAIVPQDYKVLLQIQFPEINSINVYGGEKLTPPQFGKVVVALDIANVEGLPQSKLQQYFDFLKTRCPLTITPIFISPQFTYIQINTTIRYNVNVTSETTNRVKTIVLSEITSFNTMNLNDFNVTFRYSQFTSGIDASDPSIVSNLTDVSIYKKTNPTPHSPTSLILGFETALRNDIPPLLSIHSINAEKTLSSSNFTFNGQLCQLEDDGLGNVRIVHGDNANFSAVQVVGSINYNTGFVQINNLNVDSYDGPDLLIFVRTRQNDISCSLNTILAIEPEKVDITIEQIRV